MIINLYDSFILFFCLAMSVRKFFRQLRPAATTAEADDVVLNWNRGANQVFGPVTRYVRMSQERKVT